MHVEKLNAWDDQQTRCCQAMKAIGVATSVVQVNHSTATRPSYVMYCTTLHQCGGCGESRTITRQWPVEQLQARPLNLQPKT